MKRILLPLLLLSLHSMGLPQTIVEASQEQTFSTVGKDTVSYANIITLDFKRLLDDMSEMAGNTYVARMHAGCHNFQIRMMGWKRNVIIEFVVSKGPEAYLDIDLSQEAPGGENQAQIPGESVKVLKATEV